MRTVLRGALAALLVASAGCSFTIDAEGVPAPAKKPATPTVGYAAVAPDSLPFSFSGVANDPAPAGKVVHVTNTGGGTLATPEIALSLSGASWLDYTVTGPSGGPYDISFRPKSPLPAASTYSTVATITCSNASNPSFTVDVSLVTSAAPPVLAISPPTVSAFGLTEGSGGTQDKTVTIYSSSATLLGGTPGITPTSNGWLSVVGTPSPNGLGGYNVTIRATVGARTAAGSPYGGTLTITSTGATGSPMTVPVTLQVTSATNPSMTLAPSPFTSFTGVAGSGAASTPASAILTVTNAVGTLNDPTASDDASWLTVGPANKVATNHYEFTLTPDISTLTKGTYTANVTVTSSNAVPSSVTFQVILTINNPPTTSLNPTSLTFTRTGAGTWTPSTGTVAVTNTGDGALGTPTLSPTYNLGTSWLNLSTAPSGPPYTITVAPIDGAITGPGNYTADVKVQCAGASNGSPATAPSFSVAYSVPGIKVTPASVTASGTPLALPGVTAGNPTPVTGTFNVANVNAGAPLATPSASATSSGSWLSVGTATGDGSGGFNFTVSASAASLGAGTFNGTITVTSPGAWASQTVYVQLTVNAVVQPVLSVGSLPPFSLRQGSGATQTQTLTITNAGTGTLVAPTLALAPTSSWLSVSNLRANGSGYLVDVSVSVGSLTAGGSPYSGSVTVSSAGATGSPAPPVPVTFNVTAAAVGGCVQSSSHKVCAGTVSDGAAASLASSGHTIKRSRMEAGGEATLQSAAHQIARGAAVPAAATQ
jgi:hypothetical protein